MMRRLFFLTLGVSALAASSVNASNSRYDGFDDDLFPLVSSQPGGSFSALSFEYHEHTKTTRRNGNLTHSSSASLEIKVMSASSGGSYNRVPINSSPTFSLSDFDGGPDYFDNSTLGFPTSRSTYPALSASSNNRVLALPSSTLPRITYPDSDSNDNESEEEYRDTPEFKQLSLYPPANDSNARLREHEKKLARLEGNKYTTPDQFEESTQPKKKPKQKLKRKLVPSRHTAPKKAVNGQSTTSYQQRLATLEALEGN